jgi:DNA-binding XRE family transcriptional regulator
MNAPTIEHQVINGPAGNPLFVVVPYGEYLDLVGGRPDEEVFLPFEVSKIANLENKSLVRAWREHLGLTQAEVASRMGVTRAAFAQMEAKGAKLRVATLKKIAAALGVEWEQVRE